MTVRKLLTDRYLRALPPAPPGQRVEVYDARLPGFGIRVSDTNDVDPSRRGKAGRVTFILYCRFTPGAAATRRTIGVYGPDAMSLEEARRIAGEWRSLVARGVDPAVIEAERRAVEARERALRIRHSFTVVAEAFIADKLAKERNGKVAERDLRNFFMAAWGERPVSEISTLDVLEIINTKKRTVPKMAGALLVLIKRFFNWVVDQHVYGLTASPCDRLKVKALVGEMQPRSRRLTDAEIFAFWRATGRMGYPAGPVYRTLLLTGLRLNEAAQLSWQEIHGDTITIPASRMKGREGKAVEHSVPLTQAMQDVIASVPRIKGEPLPVLAQGREEAGDDDRHDEGRPRPAHAADPQGAGPPSRRGSPRRRVAAMGQPRSAPHGQVWIVGASCPAQRRRSRVGTSATGDRWCLQPPPVCG